MAELYICGHLITKQALSHYNSDISYQVGRRFGLGSYYKTFTLT